ncbi:MAG: hypothetical protein CBB87_02910 [Micavibrio sp. TMED27]|nr:hypothetical protein [Micavibrio sp.]OUT92271.1 MAG: hypothetical protein CBB87_02910 [Micavibrio sp. TMED27]|tara:strand:- start:30 stop:512 length:483 start_codon:yes stop_codon:yes gene_type:complete
MDRLLITHDMRTELKQLRKKTGWGYIAMCQRLKEQGGPALLYATLQKIENGDLVTIGADDWNAIIQIYKNLPLELHGAKNGVKRKNTIPVSSELRDMLSELFSGQISPRIILKDPNAPRKLSVGRLHALKSGKLLSISPDEEAFLRASYSSLKNHSKSDT